MVGRTISRYRISEKLGEGGMGAVYLAEDTTLEREVALKFPPVGVLVDDEQKERFLEEARAAAALHHPNVCTVYEAAEADGEMFIAMAYLEGEDLASTLAQGPLEVERAVEIARQVAEGMASAHRKGVVHRDLKPGNIRVTSEGRAVIMDFGLAVMLGRGPQDFDTTTGTLAYMSPEQANGSEIDRRSDVWAIGAVLYEMLSGERPFPGAYEQAIVYAILNEEPLPLSLPGQPELQRIVEKALAKDPTQRYPSAIELFADLDGLRAAPEAEKTEEEKPSIAILPFRNMSPDPDNEYFSDGVTEDIISAFTRVDGLHVAAKNSSFQFKSESVDVREVGEKLGVGAVLTGSVRWAGKRLRVTAQLSDAREGREIWSEKYDRVLDDVFAIQDEISQAIVDQLKVQLVGGEAPSESRARNVEAYDLYLKGRRRADSLTEQGLEEAIALFEQAIEADPSFARPYAGAAIANAYLSMHGWRPAAETMPRAKAFAEKALRADPSAPEGHLALGMVQHWFEWDGAQAEGSYSKAIELRPGHADSRAMYSVLLAALERPAEAVEQARAALELDPVSLDANRLLGYVLYLSRRPEQALEQARKTRAMDESYFPANWTIGMASAQLGDLEASIEAWSRACEQAPDDPLSEAGLAWALGLSGRAGEARARIVSLEALESTGKCGPYFLAWAYLGLGELEKCFDWLERSLEEREGLLLQLRAEALWDPARPERRFQELLARVGAPGSLAASG